MDPDTYNSYQQRIAQAISKIDNKPPNFNTSTYYKPRKMEYNATRAKEIDKENMELLKRLNIVNRLGGSVDCWLQSIKYKSNNEDQRKKNSIIEKQNKKLLKKISEVCKYPATSFRQNNKDVEMKSAPLTRRKEQPNGVMAKKHHHAVKNVFPQKSIDSRSRTRCFFEIEVKETKQNLGSIVFELYNDIVPRTCANFADLCKGSSGLSYKNTPFHRIVSGYWCQGGDVTKFNGTGGVSAHGDTFENENFNLRHSGPGILSMCDSDSNNNNSKFNITFKCLKTMDGKKVVFGKVLSGLANIYKIEEFGTRTGKPIKTIIVSNCGVLPIKHVQ